MRLIDLVKKYRGDARFDVNAIVNDNSEDVVVFLNSEADAIKDSILNAEVVRFRVSGVYDSIPTLNVLVRETSESNQPEQNTPDPAEGEKDLEQESE